MFVYCLSLFVSIQVSDVYVNVLSIIVFFSLNFSFFDVFLFLKNFSNIKYVLLAFFILSCKSYLSHKDIPIAQDTDICVTFSYTGTSLHVPRGNL